MNKRSVKIIRSCSKSGFSRRTLLAAGLGGLAGALTYPQRIWAQPVFRNYPFSLGVASGEPAADGFVLWTRIAPDPFNGGGMPAQNVTVGWELATDDAMQQVVQQGETLARPELAHSVHVEMAGLEPAREYWYRFYVGGEASPTGRAKTLPVANAAVDLLKFAVAGCQSYQHGYYTAFQHMAEEQFDFIFHYGDYIYEERYAIESQVRGLPSSGAEPYSVDDYRNRYAGYKADRDLQAAHASAPFIVSFDDHEVDNNWAAEIDQDGTPRDIFLLRRAGAFQAYYEHMPLRLSSMPRNNQMLMHRRFHYGGLADLHVLDTRQYRSDQPCGDGLQADCASALDPTRTMLGAQQERWLFDGLASSNATWNIHAQQVWMMRYDGSTDESEVRQNMDSWDGTAAARQRLFDFWQQRQISNPIVLTGDVHTNWAAELKADFADESSATVGLEFTSTSISSFGDGSDQRPTTPLILAQNPYIKFFNNRRGYLSMEVTADLWQTHYRIIDYISRPGAPLKTRATYVVEAGEKAMHLA